MVQLRLPKNSRMSVGKTWPAPEEKAAMANAPAPSAEVGQVINLVLARPETIGCVQTTLGG